MTVTVDTRILFEEDGISVELPVLPEHDPYLDKEAGMVRFVTIDEYPMEYEFPEGVSFIQGNRDYLHYDNNPDQWIADHANDHLFAVGVYEHGAIQYSLAGESFHSNDPWDYAVGAAIAIPDDYTDPKEAARAILDEYTSYCNGAVYIVWEVHIYTGDYDSCGGYYGWDQAQQVLKESF